MSQAKVTEGVPYNVSEFAGELHLADERSLGHHDAADSWKRFLNHPADRMARVAVNELHEAIDAAATAYDERINLAKTTFRATIESVKANVEV